MQINLFGNRALVLKLESCSQERLKPFLSDWFFFSGKLSHIFDQAENHQALHHLLHD